MERYSASDIVETIEERFALEYPQAQSFVGTKLYRDCLEIIGNKDHLCRIVKENNAEDVPPVKTLINIMDENNLDPGALHGPESQYMGELMAFVFKKIFGYEEQTRKATVEIHGISSATYYYCLMEFTD